MGKKTSSAGSDEFVEITIGERLINGCVVLNPNMCIQLNPRYAFTCYKQINNHPEHLCERYNNKYRHLYQISHNNTGETIGELHGIISKMNASNINVQLICVHKHHKININCEIINHQDYIEIKCKPNQQIVCVKYMAYLEIMTDSIIANNDKIEISYNCYFWNGIYRRQLYLYQDNVHEIIV